MSNPEATAAKGFEKPESSVVGATEESLDGVSRAALVDSMALGLRGLATGLNLPPSLSSGKQPRVLVSYLPAGELSGSLLSLEEANILIRGRFRKRCSPDSRGLSSPGIVETCYTTQWRRLQSIGSQTFHCLVYPISKKRKPETPSFLSPSRAGTSPWPIHTPPNA